MYRVKYYVHGREDGEHWDMSGLMPLKQAMEYAQAKTNETDVPAYLVPDSEYSICKNCLHYDKYRKVCSAWNEEKHEPCDSCDAWQDKEPVNA